MQVRRLMLVGALNLACQQPSSGDSSSSDAGTQASDGAADQSSDATSSSDQGSAQAFDRSRLIDVQISLAPSDWEQLAHEGRDFSVLAEGCQDGPPKSVYTTFNGQVTIDGKVRKEVGVRKKGFLGSLLVHRPSLKLSLDENLDHQHFFGLKDLTLNNNRQDPALLTQCLAYDFFAESGLAAPRCNFANVTVNGRYLGIYSHVETIKKAYLRRHFPSENGHLYEGQLSDFRPGWSATFAAKTNEDESRSDLDTLVAALQADDDHLLAQLEPLLDLDHFLTFWAAEVIVGHFDGYTKNRNNFYLYREPNSGKFYFLVWGPDLTFRTDDPLHTDPGLPLSVFAFGRLAQRLYALPAIRVAYQDRLRTLLDRAWRADELIARVNQMHALVGDQADAPSVAAIQSFIRGRRAALLAKLDQGGEAWPTQDESSPCMTTGPKVVAKFSTTWNSLTRKNRADFGQIELELDGKPVVFRATFADAGMNGSTANSQPTVRVTGLTEDGQTIIVQMFCETPLFAAGQTIASHGFATWGYFVALQGASVTRLGLVSAGSITLAEASTTPGEAVSGEFNGRIFWSSPSDYAKVVGQLVTKDL